MPSVFQGLMLDFLTGRGCNGLAAKESQVLRKKHEHDKGANAVLTIPESHGSVLNHVGSSQIRDGRDA